MQITVAGQSFTLVENGDGYFAEARGVENQGVDYKGSPTVITFVPPIGPLDQLDAGEIYRQVKAQVEQQFPETGQVLP